MWHKVVALFGSTHPLPSLSVASFTVLYGMGFGLPADTLLLTGLAVLTQQFSVGLSNDWLDAQSDKQVERADKPLARNLIPISLVRNASLVSAVFSLGLAFAIGVGPFIWMIVMLAVGWSYNLGLKANSFSVVPYILGFGMLPAFVTLAGKVPSFPPFWVMTMSALFGISAHFANSLPDLLEDRQTGVKALPHVLGQKASALVIAFSAASASLLLITQSTKLDPIVAFFGFGLTVVLALVASFLALRPVPPKLVFYLLIVASLVNVIMLMLSI